VISYRSDIDGLRAIAILSVVLFHAGLKACAGGFVGVDIFFVLSGYLITCWIRDKLVAGTFTFGEFYLNRVRRLAPSFFIVMAFVFGAGYLLESASGLVNLAKAFTAALAFVSNWFFVGQSGYFDQPLETNPLLHTWSLSIEEQFYLFWPLTLFLLRRQIKENPRKLLLIALGLLALSLTVSTVLAEKFSSQQAFFNSAGRIWELLTGAVLALGLIPQPKDQAVVTGMRAVGLGAIVLSIVFFTSHLPYPGHAALAPVLGAFLVIAASGNGRDLFSAFLSSAPMRFIGKISYSLYLWHWPLLVFAKTLYPGITAAGIAAVVAAAFVLATISTFGLELPVRRRQILALRAPFLGLATVLLMTFIPLGVFTVKAEGFPERWQDGSFSETTEELYKGFNRGTCFLEDEPVSNLTSANCLTPEPGKTNILIIGDSFAAALMPGLTKNFPEYHFSQGTASGCRALEQFHLYGDRRCPELNQLLFSQTILDPHFDAIFLISDWQYHDSVADTVAFIHNRTKTRVVVFGNTPVYTANPSTGLKRNAVTGLAMSLERTPYRDKLWETNQDLKASLGNTPFIALLDNYCPDHVCPLVTKDGKAVHFDWGHLTAWGAADVVATSHDQIVAAVQGRSAASK
jgi:peptidoglycan/LPS O-acetylase OafA/YrhL